MTMNDMEFISNGKVIFKVPVAGESAGRKCKCGGNLLFTGNVSISAPNVYCDSCKVGTVVTPSSVLNVLIDKTKVKA